IEPLNRLFSSTTPQPPIYMNAAIQQLRREGYPVMDSDVEKLSPLQCGHINMQGRYSFTVPESVSKGELRAFNE
ncbi:Tn3 family transposase, partial [Escherichia coli]|nr:Tn3 family transposase [Escherichia coli]